MKVMEERAIRNIYKEPWVFWSMQCYCSMSGSRAMVECHVSGVIGVVGFAGGWFGHLKLDMCSKML